MLLSESVEEQIISKIKELNRPSFGFSLERMLADLEINFTKSDLTHFVKIRNSLVHTGSFTSKEKWKEFTFILSMLDRIFLGMLSYHGEYLDIANNFTRISTKVSIN